MSTKRKLRHSCLIPLLNIEVPCSLVIQEGVAALLLDRVHGQTLAGRLSTQCGQSRGVFTQLLPHCGEGRRTAASAVHSQMHADLR